MKKLKLILTMAVFSLSSATWAGKVNNEFVKVDLKTRTAKGNLADARFSDNKNEFIGCGVHAKVYDDGSVGQQAFCQAKDEQEQHVVCYTEHPVLLEKINAINDYSYLRFGWNEEGDCNSIYISTQSFYIP